MKLPLNALPPAVVLSGPTSAFSLCQSSTISIAQQIYDGYRGLENFVWSIQNSDASDTTALAALLNALNTNVGGVSSLTIPMLTLKQFSHYTLVVTFNNFVGLNGAASITLATTS